MEISKLKPTHPTAKMVFIHPEAGVTDFLLELKSPTVKEVYRNKLALQQDLLDIIRTTGKRPTIDEQEEKTNAFLISAIAGWEGLKEDGVDVQFTPAKALEVFDLYPSIKEQIDEFLGKANNFFR